MGWYQLDNSVDERIWIGDESDKEIQTDTETGEVIENQIENSVEDESWKENQPYKIDNS